MMTQQVLIKIHALPAQGSEQKRKACINFTQMNLFSEWYMEIHCHITGICEPPIIIMSSSLFSVISFHDFSKYCYSFSLFKK